MTDPCLLEADATETRSQSSDHELLGRFVQSRDEVAFAQLVTRHGPFVLGVCKRVLGNEDDAVDAFQATFLVLARKAGSIRRRGSLSGWLYKVAYRIALKARAMISKRREQELPDDTMD